MTFCWRTATVLLIGCIWTACTSHTTRPIRDESGQTVAGSVASLERITLGGVPQWILVRGKNAKNPILLKLHGGPGQAAIATVALNRLLEEDFVVVEWDQRGAGKSRKSIEPERDMNLARLVKDTHELTELLLKRFQTDRLILVGHSWGSVIGLEAVQERPELYRAFVSTGQIANYRDGLSAGYRFLMEEAGKRGEADALEELTTIGAPPYSESGDQSKRAIYQKWLERFGALWHSSEKFDRVGWMLSAVEYALPEKLRYTGAAQRSFDLLLPDLLAVDMSTAVPEVAVPVYFAAGRHDRLAPVEVSEAYFTKLIAPSKQWIWFEESAHFPHWEEVEKFHALLTGTVLSETR
jgi:pimeloyl-ACP methyl ester carboxylesterase